MSISAIPGADILSAASAPVAIPGADALGLNAPATSVSNTAQPATTAASTENPYQSAYDAIITASDTYLLQAIGTNAQAVSSYAPGSAASSFSQISTMMDAFKTGMDQGLFGGQAVDAEA